MPIYNTKDLIPFVNQLEAKVLNLNEGLNDWTNNKYQLISLPPKVTQLQTTATQSLVRADEAMAEIGTATFKSTANRGKRLEDTLNKLREEMYVIAENAEGSGGGQLTEGVLYEELNNAIASVDATIEDGLKLDYRLRQLFDQSATGGALATKDLLIPYKEAFLATEESVLDLTPAVGVQFVDGLATILDAEGTPFLDRENHLITGQVDEKGKLTLSAIPPTSFIAYFPVRMKFADVPEDFLYLLLHQVIEKNSRIMEIVLNFENQIATIVEDISDMKGTNWTPDFSIMKNHQDVIKESITPKGLDIEVKDGLAHVMFSYSDHPYLDHFILERWDEATNSFVAYDGKTGKVAK